MLAIMFGCTSIYGLPCVCVETDHKPLETILCKPVHTVPARIQWMILSIQRYATCIHVSYKSSRMLLIADTLSSTPLPNTAHEFEHKDYDINIIHTLLISEPNASWRSSNETHKWILLSLTSYTLCKLDGQKRNQMSQLEPSHFGTSDLPPRHCFKVSKVVMPAAMCPAMLKPVHISHLRVNRCKMPSKR